MRKNILEEPGANSDQLFELAINLANARTFAGKGPINGDWDWREGDWTDPDDDDLYDWEEKPKLKAQGTYGKFAQQLASGGRVGFSEGSSFLDSMKIRYNLGDETITQLNTLWEKNKNLNIQ